jgi:2-methylaconitate cis-trans-isomerase PrpF
VLYLRGTLVRGGTSKCWIFDADQVAALPVTADEMLLAAFGAADPRQLDGVGGATSTTSKALLVRAATDDSADVEYTFAQVGIGAERVEWGSNCGNCATAAGLYAVQAGLVRPTGDRTTVRLYNTNTGTRVHATVDTPGSQVPETGSATVPGVRGHGVGVDLTFVRPAGGSTGALLPTGHPVDMLRRGGHTVRGTLADAGAPAALLVAADLGLTGADPVELIAERVPELAEFRRAAALAMGLATEQDPISYAVPKVGVIGPAVDYRTTDGAEVRAEEYDVSARMVSMHAPHPSIGLTSAIAVAAAATVPGGVVADLLSPDRDDTALRIGTPAGVLLTRVSLDDAGAPVAVTLSRAARRLAVAEVSVPVEHHADDRITAAALPQPA